MDILNTFRDMIMMLKSKVDNKVDNLIKFQEQLQFL
jgi:hypothetical protein